MSRVRRNAAKLGIHASDVRRSTRRGKKIMVRDARTGRWTHAGHTGYSDYTKHRDGKRRSAYLRRARGMPHPRMSPNWLAINLLWQ